MRMLKLGLVKNYEEINAYRHSNQKNLGPNSLQRPPDIFSG